MIDRVNEHASLAARLLLDEFREPDGSVRLSLQRADRLEQDIGEAIHHASEQ